MWNFRNESFNILVSMRENMCQIRWEFSAKGFIEFYGFHTIQLCLRRKWCKYVTWDKASALCVYMYHTHPKYITQHVLRYSGEIFNEVKLFIHASLHIQPHSTLNSIKHSRYSFGNGGYFQHFVLNLMNRIPGKYFNVLNSWNFRYC